LAKVDLPAPVAPTSATVSPGCTTSETSSSASFVSFAGAIAEGDVLEADLAADAPELVRVGRSVSSGATSSSSKILSSAAMPDW
jgi:hypothetical protein